LDEFLLLDKIRVFFCLPLVGMPIMAFWVVIRRNPVGDGKAPSVFSGEWRCLQ
jgi:hypothetical protein